MKTTIQKTIIILAAVIAIALAGGNPLFAQDREAAGLISAVDLAFIQSESQGIKTDVVSLSRDQNISLISSADLAFVATPFSAAVGKQTVSKPVGEIGLITSADYQFITGGEVPDVFAVYNDLSDSMAGGLAR